MIRIAGVTKEYARDTPVRALHEVTLTIESGARVAVMGPSGSGKSTLLNLIAGLDVPSNGSIEIDGVVLSRLSDDERTLLRRRAIGLVFQSFNLLPTLNALDNVALPLRLLGQRRAAAKERARKLLQCVALTHRADHHPEALSGGERQRVAIARALITSPKVLLADEPTGNLDSATGQDVMRLLTNLQRESAFTLLLVTHNQLAAAACDRIVALRDGQIAEPSGPRSPA